VSENEEIKKAQKPELGKNKIKKPGS